GTVVETLAEPGQFVSAGQIVVRMARAGAREAAINLPETLRPALGSTGYATLYGANADSATRYPARLRQLSDAADPLTRTFEARYVLDGVAGLKRSDRKSTRLNSSHVKISYAVFCLKKKKNAAS